MAAAATLAALSAGAIDLYRARLIAEATGPLDDDTARAVEQAVLAKAGGQTSGQLRIALRRAVIAADPEGAEQRRQDAQRHAKVSLYPDPDADTATLAGTRLPAVHAAAAMARLTAIARAMKTAGMGGSLDYLRAIAYIGLLLGTLPLVPPPAGDPARPAPPTPTRARLRAPAVPILPTLTPAALTAVALTAVALTAVTPAPAALIPAVPVPVPAAARLASTPARPATRATATRVPAALPAPASAARAPPTRPPAARAPAARAPAAPAPAEMMATSQTTIATPGRTYRYRPTRTRPRPA